MSTVEEVVDEIMRDTERNRNIVLSRVTDPDSFIIDAVKRGYIGIVLSLIDKVRPVTMFECLKLMPDAYFFTLLHKVNENLSNNDDVVENPLDNIVSDVRDRINSIPRDDILHCDTVRL